MPPDSSFQLSAISCQLSAFGLPISNFKFQISDIEFRPSTSNSSRLPPCLCDCPEKTNAEHAERIKRVAGKREQRRGMALTSSTIFCLSPRTSIPLRQLRVRLSSSGFSAFPNSTESRNDARTQTTAKTGQWRHLADAVANRSPLRSRNGKEPDCCRKKCRVRAM